MFKLLPEGELKASYLLYKFLESYHPHRAVVKLFFAIVQFTDLKDIIVGWLFLNAYGMFALYLNVSVQSENRHCVKNMCRKEMDCRNFFSICHCNEDFTWTKPFSCIRISTLNNTVNVYKVSWIHTKMYASWKVFLRFQGWKNKTRQLVTSQDTLHLAIMGDVCHTTWMDCGCLG